MSDRIALRGLRAHGRHGALPGERDIPQPFDVDVELELDLSRPAESDALGDTYDYGPLSDTVRRIISEKSYALLERLAHEIAVVVLRDERVAAVTIKIAKPELLAGATPSVTLRRVRL